MGAQFGASLLGSASGFAFTVYAAHVLHVSGFGKFSAAQVFVTAFGVLTDLGLANVIVREIAQSKERAAHISANALTMKLLLGVLAFVVVSVLSGLMGYESDTHRLIVLYGVWLATGSISTRPLPSSTGTRG